ncbi:sensor histidine kinase [Actinomadura flavalba]|uniref:sensor histidine kinase n=1 Tax=Actinomadura flavalba TaxID=1120938 RepID=UPI00037572E7|nr:sensor histidine kinase [Actinomadura flavalba]
MIEETPLRRHLLAPWRGLGLYLLFVPGTLLYCLFLTSLTLTGVGIGLLLTPVVLVAIRGLLDTVRGLLRARTGVAIDRPYLPEVAGENAVRRFARLLSDPATWRDTAWLAADPVVGAFTAALPALLIAEGVWGLLLTAFAGDVLVRNGGGDWYLFIPVGADYPDRPLLQFGTAALGVLLIALGFAFGPRLVGAYGRWGAFLLGPTEASRLKLRVRHLTASRSDAVDASAAELRRIERDLHDGAQARLVAMGMSLGAIEHLLDKDPEKARLLLTRARESSAQALHELRDLVRGIHPPVLADRGVADAVRALALDHPLDVEVTAELDGRPPAPVESAAYFAVAEILTNAAKHADAERVWIDLRQTAGLLRVSVTDDGRGGASLDGGTGLRGVERRLGTFDGVLAVSSPPGGPTVVTLELPCAPTT